MSLKKVLFFSGNPAVQIIEGYMVTKALEHVPTGDDKDVNASNDTDHDAVDFDNADNDGNNVDASAVPTFNTSILCMYKIPSFLSIEELCDFIGDEGISLVTHLQIVSTSVRRRHTDKGAAPGVQTPQNAFVTMEITTAETSYATKDVEPTTNDGVDDDEDAGEIYSIIVQCRCFASARFVTIFIPWFDAI